MNNEINKELPYWGIIKKTYTVFYRRIKEYMIISYIVMLPIFLTSLFIPFDIDTQTPLSGTAIGYLILVATLIIIFTIFLFRLYTLGPKTLYKMTPVGFFIIFGKTFLYFIALYLVLILATLSVGLLFGLVVAVINSVAGEASLNTSTISIIVLFFTSLFLILITLRVIPTFISIAIKDNFLPMKSAYYYTRDNNKRLLWIGIVCILPAFLIINLFSMFVAKINFVILYILSPISLIPYALLLAVGAEIYKCLFSSANMGHDQYIVSQMNE